MTDRAGLVRTPPLRGGLSPSAIAFRRLLRNRAAVAGATIIALVAVFSFLGPFLYPHAYDEVFSSYVRVPPRLQPYPEPAALEAALATAARQGRLQLGEVTFAGGRFTAAVSDTRAVDPRVTRYFDRANEFADTAVIESRDEGRTLIVAGRVRSEYFPLGTDGNGRDLVARMMIGGRISLAVGVLATLVSLIVGVTYGAISGFAGGRVDNVMMRIVEIVYALPFVFVVIVLVVFFGRNFVIIFIAIGAIEWLDMARIVRGQALSLRRREFVLAAEALGVKSADVVRRHIVPNALGPVVVFVTVLVPRVILVESFLSFLGLGVQEPLTSLGALIAEGAANIQAAPWLLIGPAIMFVATLFALNFLGDGLRDAFDPRDR
ncbi:MAG: ABC transporter permease subunit [Bauldia sp.]